MALYLNGKKVDRGTDLYANNIPMSPSDSDTIAEKFEELNSAEIPIQSGSATNTKDYIDGFLPKIYYFIGTTTGNSNLDVSGVTNFDYTKETIVSVCARESQNTSYGVVCTPYTYDVVNHLGYIEGLKCRSATEGRSVANTSIDGYFWTIPRGSRGN